MVELSGFTELGEVLRLRIEPGDYVVVYPRDGSHLAPAWHSTILAQLQDAFPDNKVLVMEETLRLVVLSPADGARLGVQGAAAGQ